MLDPPKMPWHFGFLDACSDHLQDLLSLTINPSHDSRPVLAKLVGLAELASPSQAGVGPGGTADCVALL